MEWMEMSARCVLSSPVMLAQRYRVETCLGLGLSTMAYEGVVLATDQPCVILVLGVPPLAPSAQKRFHQRFERIMQQLQALPRHPALVPVLDAGIDGGIPWIVYSQVALAPLLMPFLSMPLSPIRVLKILHAVAQGLAHVSAHGMVHGNLRLSSLLVPPDPRSAMVCLADTGLRSLLEAHGIERGERAHAHVRTLWGNYLGDPSTLAPECLLGSVPDEQSDIYSLGVLGAQLLGWKPRTGPYVQMAMDAFYGRSVVSFVYQANIPPPVREVLVRFIAVERQKRFRTMQDGLVSLESLRSCLEED